MKHLYYIFIFVSFLSLSVFAGPKTVVFDLDGVVLFHPGPDTPKEKLVSAVTDTSKGGDTAASAHEYRVANGFGELVDHLIENGWQIHVFSFGNLSRNESVLAGVHLPSGRSALEAIRKNGGKIFSNVDGLNLDPNDTRTIIDTSLPKDKRPKIVKSLSKVLGEEGKDAILVEDMLSNTAPNEKTENVVFLPYRWAIKADEKDGVKEVKFLEDLSETEAHLTQKGDFEKLKEAKIRYERLHGRMEYLAGLLDYADKTSREKGITPREVIKDLQWERNEKGEAVLKDGEPVFKSEILSRPEILNRGTQALSAIGGTGFKPTSFMSCEMKLASFAAM